MKAPAPTAIEKEFEAANRFLRIIMWIEEPVYVVAISLGALAVATAAFVLFWPSHTGRFSLAAMSCLFLPGVAWLAGQAFRLHGIGNWFGHHGRKEQAPSFLRKDPPASPDIQSGSGARELPRSSEPPNAVFRVLSARDFLNAGILWVISVFLAFLAWGVLVNNARAISPTPTPPPNAPPTAVSTPEPSEVLQPTSAPTTTAFGILEEHPSSPDSNYYVNVHLNRPPLDSMRYWLFRIDMQYPAEAHAQALAKQFTENPYLRFAVSLTYYSDRTYEYVVMECSQTADNEIRKKSDPYQTAIEKRGDKSGLALHLDGCQEIGWAEFKPRVQENPP